MPVAPGALPRLRRPLRMYQISGALPVAPRAVLRGVPAPPRSATDSHGARPVLLVAPCSRAALGFLCRVPRAASASPVPRSPCCAG
ncbi:hypothetical protein DZF91_28145 [Actinomadura logoneensis]|uniref:Uncharacterized protein n=1 Tax=Actinomadura logoneensis TaxID=2293572 RepID=A0A372JEG4_9ACTN|nr:hypothetical protein DZF91_28145 [Actinomadura logoneensis]